MFINRSLQQEIELDIRQKKKNVLLLGPRQTGKSSLFKSMNPDLLINLARESEFQKHLKDPSLLEKMIAPLLKNKLSVIFIDEIQRIPSLLNTVQAIVDDYKNIIFLLSGSSARKLKKAEVNLLPGRVFSYLFFPLSFWELGDHFDLIKALTKGSLPEIYLENYGSDLLLEYIHIYLKEEIIAEALVRKISSFSHFLDLAAAASWSEINFSQLASDAEIPKETIRRYFDILSETLIIHRIPGFNSNRQRKVVQKEKYLFFDLGVRNGILGTPDGPKTSEEYGNLFEQWIVLQLLTYKQYKKKKWDFYYYRDQKKVEIDLIIETKTNIVAIEIKWGEKHRKDWTHNLVDFASLKHKKSVQSYIVYQGKDVLKDNNVVYLPFERFLKEIETYIN